ncbi:MAG TPA: T9SS type A sorting domain-containing protein [Candidatus Kapabacteria bacterium]|nr:T9SS type A sorting domain-containing protein [Candidatus Kapabacteria bacterium]
MLRNIFLALRSTILIFSALAIIVGASNVFAQIPHWEKMPLPHAEYSLTQSRDGHIYTSNGSGIWLSTDSGSRWTQIETSSFIGGNPMVAGENVLVAVGNDGFLHFSADQGASWSSCPHNFTAQIGTLSYNNFTGGIMATGLDQPGTSTGLIRSTNGQGWTTLVSGLVTSGCEANIDLGQAYYFYTGGDGSIMRSTDGGTSWKSVASGFGFDGQYKISTADDGTIYSLTNDLFFSSNLFSTDNGDHWTKFPQPPAGDESPMTVGNYQYVVRPSGTYRLNATDTVWRLCVAADSAVVPDELLVLPDGRLLLAADDGVYRTSDVPVEGVAPFEHASSMTLEQNYPNPFSATTAIRFDLTESSVVTLNIYNAMGTKIRTLISGYRAAGSYAETFDATGLPSGIYTYRLTFGPSSLMRQMILLQ